MKHFIYILKCADGTYYTGYATDVERRLAEHNGEGAKGAIGAKYTAPRRPVQLVYSEGFATRSEAMQREFAIKKLSRREKTSLIKERQR